MTAITDSRGRIDVAVLNGRIKDTVIRVMTEHRALIYTALLALLVVGAVVGAFGHLDAANAMDSGSGGGAVALNDSSSPADVERAIPGLSSSQAMNFLLFDRWKGSTALPSPNVGILNIGAMLGGGQFLIGSLLFNIAALLIWLVGTLLGMALDLDLLAKLSMTIDHTFALVTGSVVGRTSSTSAGSAGISVAFVIVLLIAICWIVFLFATGQARKALISFLFSFGAVGLLMVMSFAAQANHPDTGSGRAHSAISNLSKAPSGSKGIIQVNKADANNPKNWAVMSPGWFIAESNHVIGMITGVVTNVVNSVSTAVGSASLGTSSSGSCGAYIDQLHADFGKTSTVKSNGNLKLLTAYDNLTRAVYFEPYVAAAYGTTGGAENSWCRIAEMKAGVPAGEQAYVSHQAGLYKELVDWNNNGSGVVSSSGAWKDFSDGGQDRAVTQAGDFFGTNTYSSDAVTKMTYYFAACTWTRGGDVKVAEGWKNVLSANWKAPSTFQPWAVAAANSKDNDKNYITQGACNAVVSADQTNNFGFNDDGNAAQFAYQEKTTNVVFNLFGGATGSYAKNFAPAIADGDTGAYSYYSTTQGNSAGFTALFGVMVLVIAGMVAKYMAPLILGAVIAMVVASLALMCLPIVLVAMIIPAQATRRLLGMVALTVLSASAINLMFVTVTNLVLVVMNLLLYVFSPLTGAAGALNAVGGPGSLLNVIQVGLSVFLALKVTRVLLQRVFAIDMSSFGSAAMSAGLLSGSAVLNRMGVRAPQILNIPSKGEMGSGARDWFQEMRGRGGEALGAVAAGGRGIEALRERFGNKTDPNATPVDEGLTNAPTSDKDKSSVTKDDQFGLKNGDLSKGDPNNPIKTDAKGNPIAPDGKLDEKGQFVPGQFADSKLFTTPDGKAFFGAPGQQYDPVTGQPINSPVSGITNAEVNNPDAYRREQAARAGILATNISAENGMTPDQQKSEDTRAVNTANDLLTGGKMPAERIEQIIQNNEFGGFTEAQIEKATKNPNAGAFAPDAGTSPITSAEAAATGFAKNQAAAAANATEQFVGKSEEEKLMTRLSINRQPVGVDENGNPTELTPVTPGGGFVPTTGAFTASTDGTIINPVLPRKGSSAVDPDVIPAVFDDSFMAHETGSRGGYYTSEPVARLYTDMGDDPANTFVWGDQQYDLNGIAQQAHLAEQPLPEDTGWGDSRPEGDLVEVANDHGVVTVERVRLSQRAAELGRGPGVVNDAARWFLKAPRRRF